MGWSTFRERAHKQTRCIVERGIGQLKRWFHVLHGEIRVNPIKTSKIVMVCAALHNLCKERNLQLPDDEHEHEDQPVEANPVQPLQRDNLQNGVLEIILSTFISSMNSECRMPRQCTVCPVYLDTKHETVKHLDLFFLPFSSQQLSLPSPFVVHFSSTVQYFLGH
ncbi:uncharacterized protein LOC123509717 isoform X2 [Portunus trituberculatus]|uniref:uncharacterized protein LOC123509717 isoform X2 n=1 Tax=Portunus trituberculatus TaxID=210409 RepID=UPI001E1D1B71|nr:uncharacterized protein LOC123509717 isoform X2 [Portunus trituberculatus]